MTGEKNPLSEVKPGFRDFEHLQINYSSTIKKPLNSDEFIETFINCAGLHIC